MYFERGVWFRSWTLRNYGETGKTKTVTRAKYERIVAILSGLEPPTADNSKLRFWIKAKAFRLGYPLDTDPPTILNRGELYIPSKTWVCRRTFPSRALLAESVIKARAIAVAIPSVCPFVRLVIHAEIVQNQLINWLIV